MRLGEFLKATFNINDMSVNNKRIFKFLAWLVGFFGFLLVLNLLFPQFISTILNIIWILLLLITLIFLFLGVLVIVGLRKEATRILDFLLEGSLTILEVIEFLKLVYKRFIELLKEFMLFIAPVFAYVLSAVIYLIVLLVYKYYGQSHDLTYFTVGLTAALVLIFGYFNRPRSELPDLTVWKNRFKFNFRSGLIDGFEVVLFVFFLTMDSTSLFFLPDEFNIPLKAVWHDYDFMKRGFTVDPHLKLTINIIIYTLAIEILRYALRLVALARKFYSADIEVIEEGQKLRQVDRIKTALRKAFKEARDNSIRFITFNTVVLSVFLLFPRLKLLALFVTSLCALLLDILIQERLVISRGNDLMSRIINKVFRV